MKKTNKIISILLVIAMMLTMAPIAVFTTSAADIEVYATGTLGSGGRTAWTIYNNGLLVVDGKGNSMTSVNWDSTTKSPWKDYADVITRVCFVNCENWKSLPAHSFKSLKSLKEITLPENLEVIQELALGYTGIETVELPKSLKEIGKSAFSSCESLNYVNIHDGITKIGNSAFSNCYSLKAVSIPDSVTSIGQTLFQSCTNLEYVRLNENITKIGGSMFYGCAMLENVSFPASVTEIGTKVFYNASNLEGVYYHGIAEPTTYNPGINNATFSLAPDTMVIYVPNDYNGTTMGLKASWENDVHNVTKIDGHFVNIAHTDNGAVKVGASIVPAGDTVTIDIMAYKNYEIDTVTVTDSNGQVELSGSGYSRTFTMPEGDVTIAATFKSTATPHVHSWIYAASGATITATCAYAETCHNPLNKVEISKGSTSLTFVPNTAKHMTVSGKMEDVVIPDLVYTLKSTGEPITPINPGVYVASLTIENVTATYEFEITRGKFNYTYFTYTAPQDLTYDGTPKYATVVMSEEYVLYAGEYTVYYNTGTVEPINAGKYTAKVKVEESEYFAANTAMYGRNWTFTIEPKSIEDLTYEGLAGSYPVGAAPDVTIKYGDMTLVKDTDYTVEYANNTESGTATMTITGIGNYTGTKTLDYTVSSHTHAWVYSAGANGRIVATCVADDCTLENGIGGTLTISAPADLYADGTTAKEVVIDNQLVEAIDYTVTYSTADGSAPKTAGTYTASVTVGGATASLEYTLIKRNAAADMFVFSAPANLVYDGTAKYATVEVSPEITGMGAITVTYYKDGEAVEPVDAGTYTVKVSTAESDKYYAINDVELASFTITAKDISDGFIILGDPLTYNGTEQTQTVEKVLPTGTAPEATYTVSGNKATNVGVYLLTVTGTGNFTGEAKIVYEIAVDMNGVDFDQLHVFNVKSTDKERIEYIYNQVHNASTEYADEEKKEEWFILLNNSNELLLMINSVTSHLESFKEEVAGYDIDTVTSDDYDYLEGLYESEGQWLYDHGENYTDEEIKEFSDTLDDLQKLKIRISDVAKEITRITNAVNGYDEATVKYGDYKDILQLIDDIEALTTGKNITDFERSDLEELNAKANLLAAKIRSTADEISRITREVNAYSIDTVKSSDKADIENLIARIRKLTDGDNITDDERANLNELDSTLDALLAKIDETADEIARIEAEVGKYDEATIKSSDKTDLEQLKADIKALTDGQNITADERAKLENLDATADALLAKIAETTAEYDRVIAAANGYDEATVTSADKDALVQLNDDIYALALTDNVTEEEKENLQAAHDKVLGLIDKLTDISDEIKRIIEAVDKYVFESVKSSDKTDIEQLIADIKELLDTKNITADERALLSGADETCTKLIEKIDETVAEISRINDATNAYDEATVTGADKADIEKLLADIKALTDGDNITDAERAQLNGNEATLKALLDKIGATADEIARIETAVNGYDEETVKSTDKADIEQLKDDIKALTDKTNITDEERAKLGELDATIDALLKKIADTQAEIERIDEAVDGYDIETVNSGDVQALGNLIEDIETLTNGDNITEEEKAVLEEKDAAIDELIDRLAEVAEEIAKVNDAVNSYDENSIKSSDSEDLEQLKEDIQAAIDCGNVTENEITALEEMIADVEALEDKIAETEEQLEKIKDIENGYDPETVTSDDKADIEEAIAEIEKVNPDNLTEEQKAEYDEIKAGFEALLEEITAAEKDVTDISVELEMFDEERVTIFWEDEIEALKAKIDELLADENMGEAEKAKLNEYKAQCDNLIEIINNPSDYFSMRLFHFVWDALHWLSSHVVFIFNWIVSMF